MLVILYNYFVLLVDASFVASIAVPALITLEAWTTLLAMAKFIGLTGIVSLINMQTNCD